MRNRCSLRPKSPYKAIKNRYYILLLDRAKEISDAIAQHQDKA